MIRGIHGLFYSSAPEDVRAFIRDRLGLPYSDVGGGWLIFDLDEGDLGVHPIRENGEPASGTHNISFYCDDIQGTVAALKARGVDFSGGIEDRGYGFVTAFTMPGGVEVELYEPKYRKGAMRPSVRRKASSHPHRTAGARRRTRRRRA